MLVGFIGDNDYLFALASCGDVGKFFFRRDGVDDPQDDGCLGDGGIGALNTDLLDDVVGGAQSRGVDKTEGDAVDVDGVLDDVARGAVDVADDGFVLTDKAVEEGALTHIGLADDCHGNALLDCLTGAEGGGKRGDAVVDGVGKRGELGAVGKLEFLVVAEVEFEFHERGHLK